MTFTIGCLIFLCYVIYLFERGIFWAYVLSMTVNCLTQLHNLALLMFEFFAASVLPVFVNVLHSVLTAAAGALIAWAIGKLRTSFA